MKKKQRFAWKCCCTQAWKLFEKIRPWAKDQELFWKIHEKFTAARRKSLKISFVWFYANANKINKEIRGQDARRLTDSGLSGFINACKIKLLWVQRKRQSKKTHQLPAIMQWHSILREGIIKASISLPCYDKKSGRLTPDRRFNIGQVPVSLTIDCKTSRKGIQT